MKQDFYSFLLIKSKIKQDSIGNDLLKGSFVGCEQILFDMG